ncbi:Rieske (2Fe-2S) protein [Peribacillus cavernae]|uniref:Rieske (2Fe-2S) protein n=1 Tax=Peribacillus cavernae TaxID=1674310 RepID=A0A433HWM6_9BACI|nr:Rieske (2Fe-2S) protein [Peribacillus cavernae]MDQ0218069.1 3-phenylpropionate/trans-cinnamate dioxygenase ferredoxin subunit [Peribacillus cavernae]RUQ32771.1 Rieske (2Fe-2S) protein [Peribacillus cavernae]
MGKHVVCKVSELPPGERKIVTLERRSIGIFNIENSYYALKNVCPHYKAPLCKGVVTGMTLPSKPKEFNWGREGEILRCPWHGWEFDIKTGKSIFDPHKCFVKSYEVTVEEESESVETFEVTVELGAVVVHI